MGVVIVIVVWCFLNGLKCVWIDFFNVFGNVVGKYFFGLNLVVSRSIALSVVCGWVLVAIVACLVVVVVAIMIAVVVASLIVRWVITIVIECGLLNWSVIGISILIAVVVLSIWIVHGISNTLELVEHGCHVVCHHG